MPRAIALPDVADLFLAHLSSILAKVLSNRGGGFAFFNATIKLLLLINRRILIFDQVL